YLIQLWLHRPAQIACNEWWNRGHSPEGVNGCGPNGYGSRDAVTGCGSPHEDPGIRVRDPGQGMTRGSGARDTEALVEQVTQARTRRAADGSLGSLGPRVPTQGGPTARGEHIHGECDVAGPARR